jgi:hypothetical protein
MTRAGSASAIGQLRAQARTERLLEMAKDDASTKRRVAGETTRGQRVPYSRDLADTLLERLGAGETMSDICRDPAMPARSSVMRWISEDKDGFGRLL